jgi:hypothetical protein
MRNLRMGDKVMSKKLEKKEAKLVKSVQRGNAKKGLHLRVTLGKVVLKGREGNVTVTSKLGLSVRVNPARPEKVWNEHEMSDKAGHWMLPLLVVSVWKRTGNVVQLKQWVWNLLSKHVKEVNEKWGTSHAWAGTKAWEKAQRKTDE